MSEVYPTYPVPSWPYDIKVRWNTTISSFDGGKEQRRQKNLYPKYDVSLTYPVLSVANMQILWSFYQARRGTYEPFYFYSLESTLWEGCYIGIGDGTTTTFDIPGRSTTAVTIYQDGVALSATGLSGLLLENDDTLEYENGDTAVKETLDEPEYVLHSGGGAAASDRVTFVTAPAVNDLLTCDFTGYLRIRCRFQEELSRSAFTAALYKTGIKLKGLSHI
jgi:hypothetical protein